VADDPSAQQQHRGTRAVQRMVEYAPSSGGLALWVKHQDLPADQGATSTSPGPMIHTDGHTLFYRADFDQLPLPAQAGWVAHGVLHVALRHPQRYLELQARLGEADLTLFNTCADAIVNSALSHLGWLQVPERGVTLERLLVEALGRRQAAEAALLEWDVESLYRAIDDRRPAPQRGAASRESKGGEPSADQPQDAGGAGRREDGPKSARVRQLGGAAAADLRPDARTRGAPEDEAEQSRTWSERIARAHAGDGAHSLLRALLADLPRSRTPWEQVLRTQLARGLSRRPSLSWSRPSRSYLANQGRAGPNRRMPWEPGTVSSRAVPRLAVVVDVSGSIANDLLERFTREIEAIARRSEASLVLIVGDERVLHVQQVPAPGAGLPRRPPWQGIQFHGGGGTDFTPMLQELQRHRPDIAVVLTDLEGPARFQPTCPVIWAVPESPRRVVAPFGRLLALH
jgi:Putative metallopeptidase domain/VWA-like domain (DUF2201)